MTTLLRLWLRLDHAAYLRRYGHAVPPVDANAAWLRSLAPAVVVDRDRDVLHAAPVAVRRWRARAR
jgi:hypothetical protein